MYDRVGKNHTKVLILRALFIRLNLSIRTWYKRAGKKWKPKGLLKMQALRARKLIWKAVAVDLLKCGTLKHEFQMCWTNTKKFLRSGNFCVLFVRLIQHNVLQERLLFLIIVIYCVSRLCVTNV